MLVSFDAIVESTLLKLKQGARLDTCSSETECENLSSSSNSVQTSDICSSVCSDTQRDTHDAMAIDSASGQCESSKQLKKKNSSVLSMFCRYKNLAQARNSSHTVDTVKETENDL